MEKSNSCFQTFSIILICVAIFAYFWIIIWMLIVLLSSDQLQCKTADLQTWAWVTVGVSVLTCVLQICLGKSKFKSVSASGQCFQLGWLIYGALLTWGENTCKEETPDLYQVCNDYLVFTFSIEGVICLLVLIFLCFLGVSGASGVLVQSGHAQLQEEVKDMESQKV